MPHIRKSHNPIFAVHGIVGASLAAVLNFNTPERFPLGFAALCVILIAAFWVVRRYTSANRRE